MKLHVEIDCTADEARRFFGLPDVAPMQADVMDRVQKKLTEQIDESDFAELVAQWVPMTMKGMDQMQQFWSSVMAGAGKQGKK